MANRDPARIAETLRGVAAGTTMFRISEGQARTISAGILLAAADVADMVAERDATIAALRAEVADLLPMLDADAMTISNQQAEIDRLRAADAALLTQAVSAHEPARKALREAYTVLAFAFNRLHGSARSRDTELCDDIGKVRGRIEKVFRDAGEWL